MRSSRARRSRRGRTSSAARRHGSEVGEATCSASQMSRQRRMWRADRHEARVRVRGRWTRMDDRKRLSRGTRGVDRRSGRLRRCRGGACTSRGGSANRELARITVRESFVTHGFAESLMNALEQLLVSPRPATSNRASAQHRDRTEANDSRVQEEASVGRVLLDERNYLGHSLVLRRHQM